MRGRPWWGYYIVIELLVSITVIAVCATVIMSGFERMQKMVIVSAASAETLMNYRTPFSVYYALQGEWPKDREDLRSMFPKQAETMTSSFAEVIKIENGVIDIRLRKQLPGQVLSLHPAVPTQDPLGPVKWVVSAKSSTPGWSVSGQDHTTVAEEYIAKVLKQ